MSKFSNVTVIKKANIYFNGGVASRTLLFPDGSKKTLGIMQPGEYEFSTGDKEIMEIISGELEWQIAGEKNWKHVSGGGSFEIPANTKFLIKVKTISDYCCSFIK